MRAIEVKPSIDLARPQSFSSLTPTRSESFQFHRESSMATDQSPCNLEAHGLRCIALGKDRLRHEDSSDLIGFPEHFARFK